MGGPESVAGKRVAVTDAKHPLDSRRSALVSCQTRIGSLAEGEEKANSLWQAVRKDLNL